MHMRVHLYVMKQIQNQMKYSTNWFLSNILDLPTLNFLNFLQNTYTANIHI
jgi:hypothetical protein